MRIVLVRCDFVKKSGRGVLIEKVIVNGCDGKSFPFESGKFFIFCGITCFFSLLHR